MKASHLRTRTLQKYTCENPQARDICKIYNPLKHTVRELFMPQQSIIMLPTAEFGTTTGGRSKNVSHSFMLIAPLVCMCMMFGRYCALFLCQAFSSLADIYTVLEHATQGNIQLNCYYSANYRCTCSHAPCICVAWDKYTVTNFPYTYCMCSVMRYVYPILLMTIDCLKGYRFCGN